MEVARVVDSAVVGRMRDVAGKLSEREIDQLAQYYSEMR